MCVLREIFAQTQRAELNSPEAVNQTTVVLVFPVCLFFLTITVVQKVFLWVGSESSMGVQTYSVVQRVQLDGDLGLLNIFLLLFIMCFPPCSLSPSLSHWSSCFVFLFQLSGFSSLLPWATGINMLNRLRWKFVATSVQWASLSESRTEFKLKTYI